MNLSDHVTVRVRVGELARHVRVHTLEADNPTTKNFRLNGIAVTESQVAFRAPGTPFEASEGRGSVAVKPVSAQVIEL